MRASLDTNVVIHFYKAGLQNILYDFFDEGVFIYEQIRNVELEHHGKDILPLVDDDIRTGRLAVYTDDRLRELGVYKIFAKNVHNNRLLYGAGDLGEVYAIALAQTIGAYSLVTDDIKQGGPYMSLLQFEDEVMPFTFVDILLLRYLMGNVNASQTVADFVSINQSSKLHWNFNSHIAKFIRRFWTEPYRIEDKLWMQNLVRQYKIPVKSKFQELRTLI